MAERRRASRTERRRAEEEALARREAEANSVERDKYLIAGFFAWLTWLGEQPEGGQVRASRVAQFYDLFVGQGLYPTEIEERLGLPHWVGWDS